MAAHSEKKREKNKHKMNGSDLASKQNKTFKKTKRDKPQELPPPTPLLVQDEDPAFPRGGGRLLSKQEEAEAQAEAEAEFVKEENEPKKGKDKGKKKGAKKKKRSATGDDDLGSLFGEGISGKLPRFANRITLKIDEERHRISLGMKKSYMGDAFGVNLLASHMENNVAVEDSSIYSSALQESGNLPFTQMMFEQDGDPVAFSKEESRASIPPLQVSHDESDSSDMDNTVTAKLDNVDADNVVAKKSDRRAKKKKKGKEERESEISACEERNLKKDIPRTEEEFEKLVRCSPNSSFVWAQYMAFMESLANVEKARSIAERALRTINFREEREKLNVWTACFNLENQYGNPPEDAVKTTFHRALQYCDPKKVHLSLLGMYERTEQHKLAEDLLERMTKRFRTSCKVWLQQVQILLRQGKDGIQPVVNRALLSLPRQKHIKFISQAAILEFKCGIPDRGRSMFEGILREYPKRTDLWSVYLDQEIRLGNPELIRALFERVTCLSLPPKKMKFIFAKYLNYEKTQQDDERIEYVTRKAMEYVESLK